MFVKFPSFKFHKIPTIRVFWDMRLFGLFPTFRRWRSRRLQRLPCRIKEPLIQRHGVAFGSSGTDSSTVRTATVTW